MNGHAFAFPPPPPPPPQASQNYHVHHQPQRGHNRHGVRNNRGGRGNRGAFRGVNSGFQGLTPSYPIYSRDSDRQSGHRYEGYSLPTHPPVQAPQFPPDVGQGYGHPPPNQLMNNAFSSPGHGAQQYNSGPQPLPSYGYQAPANGFQPPRPESQRSQQPPHGFNGVGDQSVPPEPAIRMGFESDRQSHERERFPQQPTTNNMYFPIESPFGNNHSHAPSSFANSQPNSYSNPNPFGSHRGRGQKRGHAEVSGKPRNHNPKPRAAPAVPSFGGPLPLPVKPPPSQDSGRRPRKKKRKHNQLGLTPKAEEHESSEEEDDVDEESKLAAAVTGLGLGSQLLQFEYRGRTSTLSSSSDIAAWIEERKKRYPTKARAAEAAERKRQRDEAKKAEAEARRKAQEKQRLEREAEKSKREQKEGVEDAATKAKRKVEKLRKQLEKEERRAARAEAKASKTGTTGHLEADDKMENDNALKRKRSDSEGSGCSKAVDSRTVNGPGHNNTSPEQPHIKPESKLQIKEGDVTVTDSQSIEPKSDGALHGEIQAVQPQPDPLTPTSQPPAPEDDFDTKACAFEQKVDPNGINQATEKVEDEIDKANNETRIASISTSVSSSESVSSDSEDLTSSSGSSSTVSDSEDDAPCQTTSKRSGPEKVPPPKRDKPKAICKNFLNHGRCRWGDNCRWRHELPEKGSRMTREKETKRSEGNTQRVGLHQRLVEREKEQEDDEILRAIMYLGDKGLLNPEVPKEQTQE
ncbi:hypothetical protein ACLMJK_002649 [Lecanora helva]